MDRKKFLVTSSLTAIALTTFGSVVKTPNSRFAGDCETTDDILGPFYRPDAPIRSDLTFSGLAGNRIQLKGTVYGEDCVTPLKNALVEIWHCDTEGEYDNKTKEYKHRARLFTDEHGAYEFQTILPGKYLNGKLYRPAHIHYRVTEKNSKELISQIYFMGDPHIAEDPWASQPKATRRILPVAPDDVNGNLSVTFDVYLSEK